MTRIKARDTGPELIVRRLLHRLGLRFRLHRTDLPGTPDVVLPRLQTAIFVHGCFWHRHQGCRYAYEPKSRTAFWLAKFASNVARDTRQIEALSALGWRVEVVWECETRDMAKLEERLRASLPR